MFFSATQKSFLPAALRARYETAGTWPDDAVNVPPAAHQFFSARPPAGKALGATPAGLPAWVDAVPRVIPFTEAAALLSRYIQLQLDAAAQAAGYDDIRSAVSYADEPAVAKFQEEGQAFRAWRSKVWEACYQWMNSAAGDVSQLPKQTEVMALLPALVLPQSTAP